jgi:hypothetical protein
MTSKDELVRAGAEYLARGFSVIPVIDKKPCIDWKQFQKKAMTVIEFQKLFEIYKPTGIAIITGEISGITVVDVDSEEANAKLKFPNTPQHHTKNISQILPTYKNIIAPMKQHNKKPKKPDDVNTIYEWFVPATVESCHLCF